MGLALAAGCPAAEPEGPRFVDGLPAHALGALPADHPALERPDPAELAEGTAAADVVADGLAWSVQPDALQVWRPTTVTLRVDALPDGHDDAVCTWEIAGPAARPDDAPLTGCETTVTFPDGKADAEIVLTLRDGDWTRTAKRALPLERLPVVTLAEGTPDDEAPLADAPAGTIPRPPRASPTSFRAVFVADTAFAGTEPEPVMQAMLDGASPGFVVHVGGVVRKGEGDAGWDRARDSLDRPTRGAKVPMAWAMSPTDLAEGARVRRPTLTLLDAADYPERYTFTYGGAFFMVVGGGDPQAGLGDTELDWMRTRLEEAQVYTSRFVVSYLPLHAFSDAGGAHLAPKFPIYELLLRARVTALVSAGHRVYFKGRYGALPVLSVGALTGPGGRLSDTDFTQPNSYAVMDVVDGVPQRVFAVTGPRFDQTLDESYLPETVEVYTK